MSSVIMFNQPWSFQKELAYTPPAEDTLGEREGGFVEGVP